MMAGLRGFLWMNKGTYLMIQLIAKDFHAFKSNVKKDIFFFTFHFTVLCD